MIISTQYQPHIAQLRFHRSNKKWKLFLAGIGAGKTIAGVHEACMLMEENPKCDGIIGVPTYPMFRRAILPTFRDFIPQQLWKYKSNELCIEWKPTGRSIHVATATNADQARGSNVAWCWMDEPAMLPSSKFFRILSGRVRDPRATRRETFCTTTPRGLSWLVKIFQKYIDEGSGLAIRARTEDNRHLPPDFAQNLRIQYGPEFAAQELDAKILSLSGLVWPVKPGVNIRPFEWCASRCTNGYFGGADSGFTNPAALIVFGVDWDGRYYIVDEWRQRGRMSYEIAQQAAVLTRKWNVQRWWSDHDPELIAQMQYHGCPTEPAVKTDKLAQIHHVRNLIPVRGDTGEPHLFVADSIREWMTEQQSYEFPPGDPGEGELREEPVSGSGDHALDASRYGIFSHWSTYGGSSEQDWRDLAASYRDEDD